MMGDIIMGSMRRDYQAYSKHFSVALKSAISPEEFLQRCDEYRENWGSPGERQVVCIFRKEKSFSVVWRQKFDKTEDQVALIATVALKGGRYFIDHFSVI